MEIANPKRILVLGAPDAGVLSVLKDLTGSAPTPIDSSTAGLSHSWDLTTTYYTAKLNFWIDEIADVQAWREQFSTDEAREVIVAVGAWIYVFRKPVTEADVDRIKSTIEAIRAVIETACGEYWEGTCLAVGTRQSTTTSLRLDGEEWEDYCMGKGFEYIDVESKGKNEYGEPVGVERLREALETTEWEGEDSAATDDFEATDDFGDGVDFDGLSGDYAEWNMELFGMKNALHGGNVAEDEEELKVEEMNRMMNRLLAIKDTTAGMPEPEKKKFAAKAVKDFMKDV